jgi:hypothetical protein
MRWRAAVVAMAIGAAFVPIPPNAVERVYSTQAYVTIQSLLTSASNRSRLALLDLLIAGASLVWIGLAVRDARGAPTWLLAAARTMARTIVWSAAIYLIFLAAWGLNYRRQRLVDKLPFDGSGVTASAAREAGGVAVHRLNMLHDQAHAEEWPAADQVDPRLAGAFGRAIRDVGIPRSIVLARPKSTMLDWYLRRAGVDGMTDPFFLETLVAGGVLPFERPFVMAHEWSHLAGIAHEGEANFVAWLACVRGPVGDQYSGWLFLFNELAGAVNARDRATLAATLGAGPRAALRAIRDRFARDVNPWVSTAGWRVYDSYLKANRVEAGAASYAEVVRLVLGVRLLDAPILTPSVEDARRP